MLKISDITSDRLEFIISTLNRNTVKEIIVEPIGENGEVDKLIITIGSRRYRAKYDNKIIDALNTKHSINIYCKRYILKNGDVFIFKGLNRIV